MGKITRKYFSLLFVGVLGCLLFAVPAFAGTCTIVAAGTIIQAES